MVVLEFFLGGPSNFSYDIISKRPIILVCRILNNFYKKHKKNLNTKPGKFSPLDPPLKSSLISGYNHIYL